MYGKVVKGVKEGKVWLKDVMRLNMDEYVGLGEWDGERYECLMGGNVLNDMEWGKENIDMVKGNGENVEEEWGDYEEMIEEGGGMEVFMGGMGRRKESGGCGVMMVDKVEGEVWLVDGYGMERMRVLKDGGGCCMYGMGGGNGVIMVSRKGGNGGKSKIDLSEEVGLERVGKKMEVEKC